MENSKHAVIEPNQYTYEDVKEALSKDNLSFTDFAALLSPIAEQYLEEIANVALNLRMKYFGNNVSIYTPLYISNYCENNCLYCGFNSNNKIHRASLSFEEIEKEMLVISKTGLKEILILTGEDSKRSNVEYISKAVQIASKYFTTIGLEIYPLSVEEYKHMYSSGADFVSIYQETYDKELYQKLHIRGPKQNYENRYQSPGRALEAGMYGVSLGVLLGLGDFRMDAYFTGIHAYNLHKKYPEAEISFSVPRLRSFKNDLKNIVLNSNLISEKNLLQVILAYRIFMPFAGISISTRERGEFRDQILKLAATKISAEVKTSVGGHVVKKGDEQFTICDSRDVVTIHNAIQKQGMQPIYTNHYSYK